MSFTVDSLKSEHPSLYEQIRTEAVRDHEESFAEKSAELTRLQTENQELLEEQREQARHQRVATLLEEAQIPASLRSERFQRFCLRAPNDEALAELIHMRKEDARLLVSSSKPVSIEQNRDFTATVHDGESFAAAIS